MNTLNKKLTSTTALISKLEQRISSLESGFELFTKRIQEESNSRLELAKSSQINYSTNAFQIQSLKEKIDLLSKSTNETLSQFKYDLTKDFSERTSHIQNIIQERSTIYETMDKKAQNTLQSKLNSVENDILTMVKKISEELTQNSAKIDFLEKRQNDNYNITREQIMDINKKIMQFQNEFTILNKFKENSNENFAGMANDIFHQQQIIEDLNSKILEQMNNYELNNSKISEELDNLKKFKEDIYKNIEMVNSKTVEEINKFIDDISNEVKNNKNEILLIEKHVTEEQKNFGNFIQEKIRNKNTFIASEINN